VASAKAARGIPAACRFALALALGAFVLPARAPADAVADDLAELSLEQLGEIQVSSVSRRSERLADVPASVYVIHGEDVRRSGATSVPEALRLAPNLHVARADANQYAVSARGFNGVLANKMLVMIDGRTVYSPLFSGVFWEAQDVVLEDIERIEVLSGPGGTMWGTNAVNGVIHVVTRPAGDTQGLLAAGGAGNETRRGTLRHGRAAGASGHVRGYGQWSHRAHTELVTGADVRDASYRGQGGFRGDWGGTGHVFTVQGDLYRNEIDQVPDERHVQGGNAIARLTRTFPSGSESRLQTFYDYSERDQPGAIFEKLHTLDVELQHGVPAGRRHQWLLGLGYRYMIDRVENRSPGFALMPADRDLRLLSAFGEDKIAITRALHLDLGVKLEHNVYTGAEVMPSARLAWKPRGTSLLWGGFARAVRAPSRIDREFFSPAAPPHFLLNGGAGFESEVSNVFELGWRSQPSAEASYALTAFHHEYEDLRSIRAGPAGREFANDLEGDMTGLEGWGSWRVRPWCRLHGGGVWGETEIEVEEGRTDLGGAASLRNDPEFTWRLGAGFDLGPTVEVDLMARQVGDLGPAVLEGYATLDARVGWRPVRALELSVMGKNLVGGKHREWTQAEFGPGAFARVVWRP
jgi:iron complex outermembrane receptor protein